MRGKLTAVQKEPLPWSGPTDKDGEDGGDNDFKTVVIDVALNGYSVTFIYDDLSEERYVLTEFPEVLELLRSKH